MKMFKKGFTLIELLVVIAIIGILATIVIVNLRSAQNSARYRAAQENAVTAAKAAAVCITNGSDLSDAGYDALGFPIAGSAICTDATQNLGNWPTIGNDYTYAPAVPAVLLRDQTFSFSVDGPNLAGSGDLATGAVTCNFQGCTGF